MERDDDDVESDVDELERLRRADPVADTDVAALSHSARARAAYTEITMSSSTTPRRRTGLALAGVAVAITALVGAVAVLGGGTDADDPPTIADPGEDVGDDVGTGDDVVSPPSLGMCVATYSEETLVERETAFAGTLLAVDGDDLTFEVEEVFLGDVAGQVTLGGGSTLAAITPGNDAPVQVGDRLLVAGDGGFAWGCGFSQPYDEAVAEVWRTATGG